MLKIKLLVDNDIVEEVLERIGIINHTEKLIFPSCYLVEDEEELYIAHFKELIIKFNTTAFDNITELDIKRRNSIAILLEDWGMIDILSNQHFDTVFVNILNKSLKDEYKICHKYIRNEYE